VKKMNESAMPRAG